MQGKVGDPLLYDSLKLRLLSRRVGATEHTESTDVANGADCGGTHPGEAKQASGEGDEAQHKLVQVVARAFLEFHLFFG